MFYIAAIFYSFSPAAQEKQKKYTCKDITTRNIEKKKIQISGNFQL